MNLEERINKMKTIVSNLIGSNGKAIIIIHGDFCILKSYETIVAVCKYDATSQKYIGYKTDWLRYRGWSMTTGKHIKLFFGQFGMVVDKSIYLDLPGIGCQEIPVE